MKVDLLDLVKKPKHNGPPGVRKQPNITKQQVSFNRFEALKEMDEDETEVQDKTEVPTPTFMSDEDVPRVPTPNVKRVKGKKKVFKGYHPAGCAGKCCQSASTAPSDFPCFALS